jgi:hypothetical protein
MICARAADAKRSCLTFSAVVVGVFGAGPALADPPPRLPPELQIAVNRAIDRGSLRLQQSEFPWGSWTDPKNEHKVGYAALPALTLLECGVGPKHPGIQQAAAFIRANTGSLDKTYDLSLAILFLDRLGDPKDRKRIQALAIRLVAGQTATGGWSYKVPILSVDDHATLLELLKKLQPETRLDPLLALAPPRKEDFPTGIVPKSQGPDNPLGIVGKGDGKDAPPIGLVPGDKKDPSQSSSKEPLTGGPETIPSAGPKEESKASKKVKIPRRFQALPVLLEAGKIPLVDPPDRLQAPLWGTTDNSNTQFALLALWAARRHGVPLDRSFHLLVRRFVTSQNADGAWGYRYRFGGGEGGSPAMSCVGLIGMAVGHGLAHDPTVKSPLAAEARRLAKDKRVVKGFTALSRHIGVPTGRWQNLGQPNLYFMWSLERVGVLYKLKNIGKKDWYHWGAEILVANQHPDGHWDKGNYHGASLVLDTCLALLFLKQANFTPDLTERLHEDAHDLNLAIIKETPEAAPAPEKKEPVRSIPPTESRRVTDPPTDPSQPIRIDPPDGTPAPITDARPAASPRPVTEPASQEAGSNPAGLIVVVVSLLLLLAAGGFIIYSQIRGSANEGEEGSGRRRRKNGPGAGKRLPGKRGRDL